MDVKENPPGDGQVRVNLAAQVAGIAAQVTAALRSQNADIRRELAEKLARAREGLLLGPAPDGLVPFIDVMCGMLRGENVLVLVDELPAAFRAVYDQLVDETQMHKNEGELTLRQVLEQVSHNLVLAMKQGSYGQRRMMANTLLRMQRESARRPDLQPLIDFLEAARALLQDEDWAVAASQLRGPFQAKWEEVLTDLRD
jgi:hypothetical protein